MTELPTNPWQTEILRLNNTSLSSWVVADPSIVSQYPEISRCSFIPAGFGPPAVKIPVSASTATTATTVQGTSHPSVQTLKPAEIIFTLAASQTIIPQASEPPSSIWQPIVQSQDTTGKTQDSQDSGASVISASDKESTTILDDIQATPIIHFLTDSSRFSTISISPGRQSCRTFKRQLRALFRDSSNRQR